LLLACAQLSLLIVCLRGIAGLGVPLACFIIRICGMIWPPSWTDNPTKTYNDISDAGCFSEKVFKGYTTAEMYVKISK